MNNLELMRKRLEYQGGVSQEARMIKDKYKSFLKSLVYSYQACGVQLVQPYQASQSEPEKAFPQYKALINPDKVKQDYDDKILSIDYNTHFGPGDVFKWIGTDTYWLIYLQELTEDAYFRGEIRRCKYKIKFKDKKGNICSTWAAIRGPVETQINTLQKNQVRVDTPNLSLNILIPLNEKTLEAFDRYSEFIFGGKCWRVQATDSISIKNVLEINAQEYYIDKENDDLTNEIKDGLVIEPVNPTPETNIIGETFIMAQIPEVYSSAEPGGKWCILEDVPVDIVAIDSSNVKITWKKAVSGQFTLQWQKDDTIDTKVIVVESLL